MLENILPFYSFIRHFKEDNFIGIERFNRHIFYFDFSFLENLLTQFNFTESSLFFVGDSISGEEFKELSCINDIQCITFEMPDVENNHHLYRGRTSVIMSIYYDNMYFKSKEKKIKIKIKINFKDGILPKGRTISNVYETACMTSIVC
ncbi:hypothetical protein M9Y10_036808 [Tritrichomonas musculus]|uniref:Uncharacterized protein n=1 Tax=Tritrichomonas musculus TaxID=1915356 RepID=A0ABR2GTV2_9EUKA